MPLTLFELHKFLLEDKEEIKNFLDGEFEVATPSAPSSPVNLEIVLSTLDNELMGEVECYNGYYCLPGRSEIVKNRLNNYFYGFKREQRVKKYLWFLRHIPFVRGVAIGGSQALGQQKQGSDIDLLIITDQKFMWLARTLVSVYFQIFGVRRYRKNTQNRFCLNHYLAAPKTLDRERNLYKAMEYLRLRPVIYSKNISQFQKNNLSWIKLFFPNAQPASTVDNKQSSVQYYLEKFFNNNFGRKLETWLKKVEIKRIKQDKYTFITQDELSFHPESRHNQLLANFFAD